MPNRRYMGKFSVAMASGFFALSSLPASAGPAPPMVEQASALWHHRAGNGSLRYHYVTVRQESMLDSIEADVYVAEGKCKREGGGLLCEPEAEVNKRLHHRVLTLAEDLSQGSISVFIRGSRQVVRWKATSGPEAEVEQQDCDGVPWTSVGTTRATSAKGRVLGRRVASKNPKDESDVARLVPGDKCPS